MFWRFFQPPRLFQPPLLLGTKEHVLTSAVSSISFVGLVEVPERVLTIPHKLSPKDTVTVYHLHKTYQSIIYDELTSTNPSTQHSIFPLHRDISENMTSHHENEKNATALDTLEESALLYNTLSNKGYCQNRLLSNYLLHNIDLISSLIFR